MAHIPFNGDVHMGHAMRALIATYGIQSAIESGTWSAHTTRELRTMVPGQVLTIDTTDAHLVEEFGAGAAHDLARQEITLVLGDSAQVLPGILGTLTAKDHPLLVYLDAHGPDNPIRDELLALAADRRCRNRCVVVMHDMYVPGYPWGYNWVEYDTGPEPLSHEVVQAQLLALYPKGYQYRWNDVAEGCQRGVLYVYPPHPPLADVVPDPRGGVVTRDGHCLALCGPGDEPPEAVAARKKYAGAEACGEERQAGKTTHSGL